MQSTLKLDCLRLLCLKVLHKLISTIGSNSLIIQLRYGQNDLFSREST